MVNQDPIAVLAGTPVDTQMGVDLLLSRGLAALAFPLAENPRQQTAFQISSEQEKHDTVRSILQSALHQGCRRALVYCNSLSASVDFSILAEETGMHIVTPLQVYRALPACYRRLGLVAANAQGLAGIERVLYQEDPSLELLSVSLLPVVLSIESGASPEEIISRHCLTELTAWFQGCGMEALILGCTHFPYVKEALSARTNILLIDPAEEMIRMLTKS